MRFLRSLITRRFLSLYHHREGTNAPAGFAGFATQPSRIRAANGFDSSLKAQTAEIEASKTKAITPGPHRAPTKFLQDLVGLSSDVVPSCLQSLVANPRHF